ncbi:MAG: carbon-nitrogen hydrolase family protein [Acidobacteriota bacterium]|nr:carbon-nitrogen hydrolase family protein [Acidobacteriota bacterium]
MPQSIVVVAAVQAAPIYLNLERSLARALELIAEAAKRRAQLVVFPESWLPGYPAWLDMCRDVALWDHQPVKRLYAQLLENSVTLPGHVADALGEAARRHNLTLVMGAHERTGEGAGRGTLYNSMLTFGPTGELLNVHRKLVPTFNERLIWGQGDGRGLRAVETPIGRIGGLICWEHWMPHARQTLHIAGEDIHVALWPSVKEMHQIASRHYAFEGRCFVVAAGGIMRRSNLPAELEFGDSVPTEDGDFILNGGSCVIGPDGQYIAGPAFGSEVIILARINLERIREESMTMDVTGHFNRPDLFDFRFKGGLMRETESVEVISADEDDLIHPAEVLLPASTEALSGFDSVPALRVVKPSRTSSYESEIHGLEKQIG